MSAGLVLLFVPILLIGLVITVVVVVVVAATRTPARGLPAHADAARRHAAVVTTLAWTAAAVTFLLGFPLLAGAPTGWLEGMGLGLLPAVAGGAFLGVHALGEVTWPRPTGAVRRATLTPRSGPDVAPPLLRRAVRLWAALIAVVGLAGALTAADDGVSIDRVVPGDGAAGAAPYPGLVYAVPLLVAALLVVLAAEAVLRLIARRPAVMDADEQWDLDMRRLCAHRSLRGAQLVLGLTAAGMLMVGGTALQNVGTDWTGTGTGSTVHAVAGLVCVVLAVLAFVTAAVLTLLPAPSPALARTSGTGPGSPPPHLGAPGSTTVPGSPDQPTTVPVPDAVTSHRPAPAGGSAGPTDEATGPR